MDGSDLPKGRAARWLVGLRGRWRSLAVVVCFAAGFLFVTSSLNSEGVDLRASSVTDLDTVLLQERSSVDALQARVSDLTDEVNALTGSVSDKRVTRLQRQVDRLRAQAGFTAITGTGITVILSDAPKQVLDEVVGSGKATADELVVHQQDIQAVVNALWRGGAQGISVQGQRIISTTGIKCVGNTVVLHGVPYSPPYRISAAGDPAAMMRALDQSTYIAAYLTIARAYQLGWQVETPAVVDIPAYSGATDLRVATVAPQTNSSRQP